MSPFGTGGGGGGNAVISGVTVSGTAASGDVPVASSATAGVWQFPPGYEFGYDQITSPVTDSSTTESAGTTIITCAAHTFDGGAVLATFSAPRIGNGATTGSQFVVSLFESTTQLTRLVEQVSGASTAGAQTPCIGMYRFTPTAGSHTYTVTAFHVASAGTVYAGAGGTGVDAPAFIRFTKV